MRNAQRATLLVLVVGVGLCLLVGVHLYLVDRLVVAPGLPAPLSSVAAGAIALLGLLLVAAPVGERLLPPSAQRWLAWPAALWMGFCFLLLTALLASDALFWSLGASARASEIGAVTARSSASGWRAAAILALVLLVGGAALRGGLRPPRLRRLALEIERWPRALDGFRIVQISDIHIGALLDRRFAARLVERVNALAPDLVAVTGDLVDGPVHHLRDEVAPFAGLRAAHGVFFVTGNHDHLSSAPDWVDVVAKLGLRPLRNERVRIGEGVDGFDLVGVDDHHGRWIGGGGEDLAAALAGRDPERPAVLLAHDPATFRRARHADIDLQISGHTHGGQIWPFHALVRLAVPWVAGLHRHGRARLYVSRGTGFWGPPMRLLAPAEITELTLRAPRAADPDEGAVRSG